MTVLAMFGAGCCTALFLIYRAINACNTRLRRIAIALETKPKTLDLTPSLAELRGAVREVGIIIERKTA